MASLFSRDGAATKFFENIPVVGYVASGVHAIAGNHEHAKRAAAKCTNSTLTTIGTVGGAIVGGPVGAMAGGAGMALIGNASEAGIADNHINNSQVRGDCRGHNIQDYMSNCATGAIGGATGTLGGTVATELGGGAVAKFVAGQALSKVHTVPMSTYIPNGRTQYSGTAVDSDRNDWLVDGQYLRSVKDASIWSSNGRYRLVQQSDSNLVLYNRNKPIWANNALNKGVTQTIMQEDGNLVSYTASGTPVWASGTHGNPGAYLVVQDDGNLVIYKPNGRPIWATNTYGQ